MNIEFKVIEEKIENNLKDYYCLLDGDQNYIADILLGINNNINISYTKRNNIVLNLLKEDKIFINKMNTPELIKIYYWCTDLKLDSLKGILGLKTKSKIPNTIKPIIENSLEVQFVCKECNQIITYHPENRDDKNRIISNLILDNICNNCEEKKMFTIQKNVEDRINKLKFMPYKEYLKTDHWKKTRKKALKKANYKCELCNSVAKLNVHHKTYENKGNEKPEDLIVLCHNCHAKFHDKLNT